MYLVLEFLACLLLSTLVDRELDYRDLWPNQMQYSYSAATKWIKSSTPF